MNKKLRKFVNHPIRFFRDMHALQPTLQFLGIPGRVENRSAMRRGKGIASEVACETVDAPIVEAPVSLVQDESTTYSHPGLESFDLVGENWKNSGSDTPIAFLWSFNPWKRDFVAKYLTEYRCAFARTNTPWSRQLDGINASENKVFIFWGVRERLEANEYARTTGLKTFRMEDGFLRSAALGSEHSVASSLVLDDLGIYFDASCPSRLEQILSEFDFETCQMMASVPSLINIWRSLSLSKYSLPRLGYAEALRSSRSDHKILVIGQVEGDASIRMGHAEGWTNRRLIELARAENPDAEIWYRPHPDVTQGFREDSSKLDEISELCTVLVDEEGMSDIFANFSHAFTITSLSGFEALLHGLKVTVVGSPFYAGWGLTDDRGFVARRSRKLTLEELFCAAYLLYPRYLNAEGGPVLSCLSTMLQLNAQRLQAEHRILTPPISKVTARWLGKSQWWPVALRKENFETLNAQFGKKLLAGLPLNNIFSAHKNSHHYKRLISRVLISKFSGTQVSKSLLLQLKGYLRSEDYIEILTQLWRIKPSADLLEISADVYEQSGDVQRARELLSYMRSSPNYQSLADSKPFVAAPAIKLMLLELRDRKLDKAEILLNELLIRGIVTDEIIFSYMTLAKFRFDFPSACGILNFYNKFSPYWKAGRGHLQYAEMANCLGDAAGCLDALTAAAQVNPKTSDFVERYKSLLNNQLPELDFSAAFTVFCRPLRMGHEIGSAQALVALHRPDLAVELLQSFKFRPNEYFSYAVVRSLALSYSGRSDEAVNLMKRVLRQSAPLSVYHEALRLAISRNDYAWAESVLHDALGQGLKVSEMLQRKIALGFRQIKQSYTLFREASSVKRLAPYWRNRYAHSLSEIQDHDVNALVVATFGPGDEIRFASFYRRMQELVSPVKLTFTCEPRLFELLSRHYTDLQFLPVARVRSLSSIKDVAPYQGLPSSELVDYFDTQGWIASLGYSKLLLTTDALGDVIDSYDSFSGHPYLEPDAGQVQTWRTRLAAYKGRSLIGLSWRSSLTTYSRNEHYLSIAEISPILDSAPNAIFINLQYDDCSEELAWLNMRYPGRIIDFPDLDQMNDLGGVAALMRCLDLIIAPATTVVELAGALGCPTLLLSNSSELHWRKIPGSNLDAWHRSITHVEGIELGSKVSLIESLKAQLQDRGTVIDAALVA